MSEEDPISVIHFSFYFEWILWWNKCFSSEFKLAYEQLFALTHIEAHQNRHTMECPHLCDSVKVNRDFIKNKKCELTTRTTATAVTVHAPAAKAASISSSLTTTSSTRRSSPSATSNSNKLWKCSGMNFILVQNAHYIDRFDVRINAKITKLCLRSAFSWNCDTIKLPHSWTALILITCGFGFRTRIICHVH